MIPDSMRFSLYRLCEFEEIGGTWESIEISQRTENYTERLCKLNLEGMEGYTHIRFYKDGQAIIGAPFYDVENNKLHNNIASDITRRIDEILYDHEYVKKLNPFIQKRINQQALYTITSALVWIIAIITIFLTLFRVITILECCIGIILLIIHLIAKRKIWLPKIKLIGSTERQYYETYK